MTDTETPENALRDKLITIWQEILLVGPRDPDTDFLELDGSSLTAIRIAARVAERTGHKIDFDVLFDHPSPRLLARLLTTTGTPRENRSHEGGDL